MLAAGLITAATAPDTATHRAQVQVSQPQYSRGFHITNNGTHNPKLVSVTGDHFDSRPDIGHVLAPKGTDGFQVTFRFLQDQDDDPTYDILDTQARRSAPTPPTWPYCPERAHPRQVAASPWATAHQIGQSVLIPGTRPTR